MAKLSRRERKEQKKRIEKHIVEPAAHHAHAEQRQEGKSKSLKSFLLRILDRHYKKLLLIPLGLLVISFIIIGANYFMTGELVQRDISLKGGLTLTVQSEKYVDIISLRDFLESRFKDMEIDVRALSKTGKQIGFLVNSGVSIEDKNKIDEITAAIESFAGIILTKENSSIEFIGGSLGKSFFKETIFALLIAFVFMSIVVFITFRVPVPSLFVILGALSDIVCTFAFIILIDMKLSTAGIASLLMLIGYSVDTDILLTTRVLKREEGTVFEKTMNAMRTGLAMSLTAIAAVTVAYIFTPSEVLKQIMLIVMIGLVFDIIHTWLGNAGILRWWLEHKEKTHSKAQ